MTDLSTTTSPQSVGEVERTTMRRVMIRVGLLLFAVYVFSYLDRTNIAFAKLQMQGDVGLSEAAYGLGAGLFFIGYALFEIPSNLILNRVGARKWITRIMVTWGLVAMAMVLVQGPWSFYLVRFLLGVAEAGLVPGALLYLSRWVPRAGRARLITMFYLAVPLSTVFGAPLSGWLMGFTWWGLAGWQIMFLFEALPCLILAFVVWRCLPDAPADARWLRPEQRAWLEHQLAEEKAAEQSGRPGTLRSALRDRAVVLTCVTFFCMVVPIYTLAFYLPTIVHQLGQFTLGRIGLIVAIPYLFAAIGMWLLARSSDRHDERTWHYAIPTLVGTGGLAMAALTLTQAPALAMVGFILGTFGCISTLPVFWAQVPRLVAPGASVAGIALITAIGGLAGFLSPYMTALIKGEAPGLGNSAAAIMVTAAFLGAAAVLMIVTSHDMSARRPRQHTARSPGSPADGSRR